MKTHFHERTLVIIKPDGVQRGLIGEIISRFEKRGLKIVAAKFIQPSRELATKHYNMPKDDMITLGTRTLANYKEQGKKHRFSDPIDIAKDIQSKLVDYMMTGPVLIMIIEGAHAIQVVRKIRGGTNPLSADVGTITADYTIDSYMISDDVERAVRNLVHASSSKEEAEREINVWFEKSEIFDYDLAIEKILYSKDWETEREKLSEAS